MSETIRAFVAIELPEHVREVLAGLVDQLSAVEIRGIRTVRPDGIHIPLKFLGDVPQARVDSIVTSPSRSHDLQVPQRPSVHKKGASMPAANAACSNVSPAAIGTAWFSPSSVRRKLSTKLTEE